MEFSPNYFFKSTIVVSTYMYVCVCYDCIFVVFERSVVYCLFFFMLMQALCLNEL